MIHQCSILTFNALTPQIITNLAIILVLLCISALASGSETSLFSLSPTQINILKNRNGKSDQAIIKLLSMRDYLLATILVLNNLVNICIVILCNNTIDKLVDFGGNTGWEFGIKTIAVTFLLLLFGEIMPKVFANYNPVRIASMTAIPLLWLKKIFKPITIILVKYSDRLHDHKNHHKENNISIDELSDALEITSDQTKEEKKMLSGIISFANTEVEDIMHPRVDITAINANAPYSEVKQTIIKSGFSRIPVYQDSLDKIEGVLYVKDMIPHISKGDDFEWTKYLRKAYFIPEHKKINDLLEEFQNNHVHMAIVVDEYGSTLGLVSLEDILEEIVGEISDESDVEEEIFYEKIGIDSYIFDGKTNIFDLERVLGLDDGTFDDVKGEAETITGMMLEAKKDFLKTNDTFRTHGIKFTVVSVTGRKVEKIKVEKEPQTKRP